MTEYNRTDNPMNKPGGVMESRVKRSRKLRGTGEGKAYPKLLGKHAHRRIAEAILGRPLYFSRFSFHKVQLKLIGRKVKIYFKRIIKHDVLLFLYQI